MVNVDPSAWCASPGRTRLLTVRLSEEEYERVKRMCRERRIRTVSEFTRLAVAHEISAVVTVSGSAERDLSQIDRRMERLNDCVDRLAQAIENFASQFRGRDLTKWSG